MAYVADYPLEDETLLAARRRAEEFGAEPVTADAGATLRLLAAAIEARAVVEIGTGCGVSGLWLLRGMRADGILTTVDVEPEHQRLARETFVGDGFAANRMRLIGGRALDVLPRLTDGGYDLVFCDAAKREYPEYLTEALRLLRPGGVLAFDDALGGDSVADPGQDDTETSAVRELVRGVREDERLIPALLPTGQGLLTAVKRA
ncbi:MAG TPA: O-methyltransferase [Streptosporangiaceae bacterium]